VEKDRNEKKFSDWNVQMAYIAATSACFPPNYYDQEELIAALRDIWAAGHSNVGRLERIQRNTQVKGRHLALPIDQYGRLNGFGESNRAWTESALDLSEKTVSSLLDKAGIQPADISLLAFTTVTGLAVPSIEARLMNRMPFSQNLKRMPLYGLGCLGGAAGLARVFDYLKGHPEEAAVLLSVELCSLTLQRDDLSIENVVSSGLFGDGAAAVLVVGSDHPLARKDLPEIIDTRSIFFPETEHIMGWEFRDTGLKVLLSADVAAVAEENLRLPIEAFLGERGLQLADIKTWISHPGGPKVLEAMEKGLTLPDGALKLSWESLAEVGNISSTSVLLILKDTLEKSNPSPGSYGVLMAMGPAFCAEVVLLKW
jgi:alkylresorcinol/alkylpyrone synthase